jgi:hypothetical protein
MPHLAVPRQVPGPPTVLVQAFWVLVVLSLSLAVAVVVVASVDPVRAPVIGVSIVVLSVLWGLHAEAAHVHRADIQQDSALRRAYERRGF